MLIYYVYCVYSGFAEAHEKKQQQQGPLHPPPCINYNNPTSREREKKKIHAEIKAEWPGVITYQKIKKKPKLPEPLKWARCVKRTVVLR